MSTTESLLVITDEVAETTVLLIPKWSRDSSQNRIDSLEGQHLSLLQISSFFFEKCLEFFVFF
jgi:hypothetical protein